MRNTLRIVVLTGPHRNQKFCLNGPGECLVGRGSDCFVRLAGTGRDGMISRHHCRLTLKTDSVKIEDLGSLNGTFVDGKKVDCVELSLTPPPPARASEEESCAGSLMTVGGTTLQLDVVDSPAPEANSELTLATGDSYKRDKSEGCVEGPPQ